MIKIFFALFLSAGLVQCDNKTVTISEACGVLRETLYSDGSLKFTDEEIMALTRNNKEKILAAKNWYKKHCLGK